MFWWPTSFNKYRPNTVPETTSYFPECPLTVQSTSAWTQTTFLHTQVNLSNSVSFRPATSLYPHSHCPHCLLLGFLNNTTGFCYGPSLWLPGYRINFKIFSKEHKAIMNWSLSKAYFLSSILHRLHPNFVCTTLTDSCLFYISCLRLLFTLIFLLVTYMYLSMRIQIMYFFLLWDYLNVHKLLFSFVLSLYTWTLSLVCFLEQYTSSQSVVP